MMVYPLPPIETLLLDSVKVPRFVSEDFSISHKMCTEVYAGKNDGSG